MIIGCLASVVAGVAIHIPRPVRGAFGFGRGREDKRIPFLVRRNSPADTYCLPTGVHTFGALWLVHGVFGYRVLCVVHVGDGQRLRGNCASAGTSVLAPNDRMRKWGDFLRKHADIEWGLTSQASVLLTGWQVTETRTLQTNFETQLEQVKNHIFQTVKAMSEELVSVKRELADSHKQSAAMLSDLRSCQTWGARVHGELMVRDVQYYKIQHDLVKAEERADVADNKITSMEKEFEAERELATDRDRRVNEVSHRYQSQPGRFIDPV